MICEHRAELVSEEALCALPKGHWGRHHWGVGSTSRKLYVWNDDYAAEATPEDIILTLARLLKQ